jgi:hypothetical protein
MKDNILQMQAHDQDIKSALWDATNTLRGSAASYGLEGLHPAATLLQTQLMDQAIHNKIVSFVRGIGANLGSRSHLTPGSRTHSADPKKSESPRWR